MSDLAAQGVRADNVFMSFAVTSDSHTLDAYRARGGYEALGEGACARCSRRTSSRRSPPPGCAAVAGRTFRSVRSGRS